MHCRASLCFFAELGAQHFRAAKMPFPTSEISLFSSHVRPRFLLWSKLRYCAIRRFFDCCVVLHTTEKSSRVL